MKQAKPFRPMILDAYFRCVAEFVHGMDKIMPDIMRPPTLLSCGIDAPPTCPCYLHASSPLSAQRYNSHRLGCKPRCFHRYMVGVRERQAQTLLHATACIMPDQWESS